jgi:hypothetical protein
MLERGEASLDRLEGEEPARRSLRLFEFMREYLAFGAASLGALLVICAWVYRRTARPDWTGGEAFEALWPIHLVAALAIYLSWRWNNTAECNRPNRPLQ